VELKAQDGPHAHPGHPTIPLLGLYARFHREEVKTEANSHMVFLELAWLLTVTASKQVSMAMFSRR
jgi:hypothetical protein